MDPDEYRKWKKECEDERRRLEEEQARNEVLNRKYACCKTCETRPQFDKRHLMSKKILALLKDVPDNNLEKVYDEFVNIIKEQK